MDLRYLCAMLAPPPPEARNAAGLTVTDTTTCLARSLSPLSPTTQSIVRGDFPSLSEKPPNWRGCVRALCLCKASLGFRGAFRGCSLWPWKSRFPATQTDPYARHRAQDERRLDWREIALLLFVLAIR